jgi:hypothetical protein
MESNKT